MNEKKRRLVHLNPGSYDYSAGNYPAFNTFVSTPITSLETTQSSGHAWNNRASPTTDIGGNFTTTKVTSLRSSFHGRVEGRGFGFMYRGCEYAVSPLGAIQEALGLVSPASDTSLMQLGTKAIAKCIPTNPVVDGATAIGELKKGIPKLVGKELFKSKFKDYRKVGSEYLNVEFGWKPLVSDLLKAAKAVTESEKIVAQLHRDSGRNIRRKYAFPVQVSTTTSEHPGSLAVGATGNAMYPELYYSSSGIKVTKVITTEVQTWFSGCFTYYANLGSSETDKLARQAAEARKLYGAELTPAVVWNLAPWSWLVDWEGSIGDGLHNVSRFAQDGLVMRYGYIMQSKTVTIDYTLPYNGRFNRSPMTNLTMTVVAKSKVRRRATPFGFGFDMTALNGRQSAILGALAISRGPNHR